MSELIWFYFICPGCQRSFALQFERDEARISELLRKQMERHVTCPYECLWTGKLGECESHYGYSGFGGD